MDTMPEWVKVWGPVLVILGAMWTMNIRLEDRLGARVDRLGERVERLGERVERVESAVVENGKAIARLEVRMTRVEDDVTWLRNSYRGDR